jgi:hypothetical protein
VAAVMCCISFPLGTGIGVFGLIFLLSDEGKAYFDNQNVGQIGYAQPMMPPEPNSWQ